MTRDADSAARDPYVQGREIIEWIDLRANAALCNLALGCCEAALEMTAEYSKTRKQFDQPIAMFQSVAHRQADAYIDTQAVRLSALEVAWLISVGRDAREEVAIAKHFAAEAGLSGDVLGSAYSRRSRRGPRVPGSSLLRLRDGTSS